MFSQRIERGVAGFSECSSPSPKKKPRKDVPSAPPSDVWVHAPKHYYKAIQYLTPTKSIPFLLWNTPLLYYFVLSFFFFFFFFPSLRRGVRCVVLAPDATVFDPLALVAEPRQHRNPVSSRNPRFPLSPDHRSDFRSLFFSTWRLICKRTPDPTALVEQSRFPFPAVLLLDYGDVLRARIRISVHVFITKPRT